MATKEEYNQATKEVIDWLEINKDMTHKEVKSKISKGFKEKWGKQVSKGVLQMHIDDFTESVCLMLNIPQD